MALEDPNFPAEMGNIPYGDIIGAPLNAAIKANTKASKTAARFIQDVAFQKSQDFNVFGNAKEPVYVTFNYHKQTVDESGNTTTEEFEMRVPLLLLLHVPYVEIDKVTVDFNVKLNSVRKRAISESGSVSGDFLAVGLPLFMASASYQRTDKRSQTVKRTYDQQVHVEAGSIEPPKGVTRLLDVLEQTITETPGSEAQSSGGSSGGGSS